MANIVLIGMPGCGKSTRRRMLLAAALHMDFVDTDIVLQAAAGEKAPGTIIDAGRQRRVLEDRRGLRAAALSANKTVVATGGQRRLWQGGHAPPA